MTGRWIAALLGLAAAASAHAAAPPQDLYRPFGAETFLRFLDPPVPGAGIAKIPHLMLSFGGTARAAVMDTGSTGIVVSADAIPGIDKLPSRGPAELTYSSSGRIMQGNWVVTPVRIAGADGTAITTAPIPLIAVTRIACLRTARNCKTEERPTHVAMIGVGFAREADHQPDGTPDKNPLLNVAPASAGPFRRGYVLTAQGVHVGLTAANTSGGFAFVKLHRDPTYDDWAAAPACIAVAGGAPACGKLLVDTGVAGMFLTVPLDRLGAARQHGLTPGTRVDIRFEETRDAAGYGFVVGDTVNPVAPSEVTLSGIGRRPPFVNTSFHVLNGFDYLFDADGGWVGYRGRE